MEGDKREERPMTAQHEVIADIDGEDDGTGCIDATSTQLLDDSAEVMERG